jgi:DoxX-like family
MHVAYVVATVLAALANGYAASMNFVGANSVRMVADNVHVPQKWMVPFGVLLASGALGLVVGLAVPALGTAAAAGLVAYFICAISAHMRANDRNVGGAVTFLLLAVAALVTDAAYHYYMKG